MDKVCLNIENVPGELNLILKMLNGSIVNKEDTIDIDWETFIELSIHHRLFPVLYPITKQFNILIPETVIRQLFHLYQTNTFQMLHLTSEMEQVNNLFNAKDIPIIFLKGPMLAHELYGDISKRTCSDIDFLIPIDDLDKAENLLAEKGYIKDDYIHSVLNDWKWRHHHVTYYHPDKGVKLEIHWRLHPGPGKEPSFQELWGRKMVSSLSKKRVYMLGKDDLFLYLAAHGSRHGWSRLRWLLDIDQLLKERPDYQNIIKLSKMYNMHPALGQSIVLSSTLLNSKQADELNSILKNKKLNGLAEKAVFYFENMINLHTDHVPEEVSKYHEKYLFTLMPSKQKMLFIMSFLFPYPEDAETMPLPKRFHFMYFPLRPFLWSWRKLKKLILYREVTHK